MVASTGKQRKAPNAARFWCPVDRLVMSLICKGRARNVVLPAQLFDPQASLDLLEDENDLFFGKSFLHVHRPLW